MTRKEQLQDLWDALLRGGFVSSKKEMAQRLGITYHSLSAAFSQGEPYANDRLLGRIRAQMPERAFSRLRGRDYPIFTPKK